MKPHDIPATVAWKASRRLTSEISIPQLIGEVYASASVAERARLLEQLLRPLSVLSLVAVADGIFAKIRFRGGWPDLHIRPDDIENVRADDVIALVVHVQRISGKVVDGLVDMLVQSPLAAQGCESPLAPS
jgi:hypothetical protein